MVKRVGVKPGIDPPRRIQRLMLRLRVGPFNEGDAPREGPPNLSTPTENDFEYDNPVEGRHVDGDDITRGREREEND